MREDGIKVQRIEVYEEGSVEKFNHLHNGEFEKDRIRMEAASTIDRHDDSSTTTTTLFVCDTCHR